MRIGILRPLCRFRQAGYLKGWEDDLRGHAAANGAVPILDSDGRR